MTSQTMEETKTIASNAPKESGAATSAEPIGDAEVAAFLQSDPAVFL